MFNLIFSIMLQCTLIGNIGANAEVKAVMENVVRLGDSEDRKVLTGMVRDALTGAKEVGGADEEAMKKVVSAKRADMLDANRKALKLGADYVGG